MTLNQLLDMLCDIRDTHGDLKVELLVTDTLGENQTRYALASWWADGKTVTLIAESDTAIGLNLDQN